VCTKNESLLSTPKAYIRSIKANGQPIDITTFQDNTTKGYTFLSNASDYFITVDFVHPLIVDSMGILQGINGTNVDTFDATLDQSPEYPQYFGDVGSLIQADGTDLDRSSSLTFHINETTDGEPPENVFIYIEGCDLSKEYTKAQVEQRITTTQSGLFIFFKFFNKLFFYFFKAIWCPITNIMQPYNLAEYQPIPNDLVDLSNSFENKPGVSFILLQNPTIRAIFNSNVSISTIALQPTYNSRTTNIIKFSVNYTTSDNKPYIDPKTGKILTFTTADGDQSLTIQHDIIPDLKGFNLTIHKTTGGKPTYFRLKVLGCYKSGHLIFKFVFMQYLILIFFS
jgi:hypothetical protein